MVIGKSTVSSIQSGVIHGISGMVKNLVTRIRDEMGEPDKILNSDRATKFFIYEKKKYGITCEKKFEIDQNGMVIAVSSRGCF